MANLTIGKILTILIYAAFFSSIIGIIINLRRASRNRGNDVTEYLNADLNANYARRKDIDPELFFKADFDKLPHIDINDKNAAKVVAHANRTMIRFETPISNLNLKMAYGPGQLEIISDYEDNFIIFIRILVEWAESLLNDTESDHVEGIEPTSRKDDALRILEYTIELGSELRKSYILAADLYMEANNKEKLDSLKETVEGVPFKDAHVKKVILEYISSL